MKNIWMERKSGIIYDFCAAGLGNTVGERFESLYNFIINIGADILCVTDLEIILGKNIVELFRDRLSHIYPNANFNLLPKQFQFIGHFNLINVFACDMVGDNNIHVDLLDKWQKITVKGL